jgi:SOS-response transcriptional repressor LexA
LAQPTEETTPADRIRNIYENMRIDRGAFARNIGFSYEKLSNYVSGRSEPSTEFWVALKKAYPEFDLDYIVAGVKQPPTLVEIKVPIVHQIHAGDFVQGFPDEEIIDYVAVSRSNSDRIKFGLVVNGDSMMPEICDNDIALCAPNAPFVSGKVYAAVLANDEATLKRVFRRKGGYELVPTNPEYDTKLVEESQIIRLVRVVVLERNL